MPTIPGAGQLIIRAADKVCERLPNQTDKEVVYAAAGFTAMTVDPVGTTLEIGRRLIGE